MKVLIVCSKNSGSIAPFIVEQVEAIQKLGVDTDFFTIKGKGIFGYLKNLPGLKRKIKQFSPDLIHAHYGFSGLLANLQRQIPVVTTYHGSDINDHRLFRYSRLAITLSKHNIFVSQEHHQKGGKALKSSVIPCGIDLHLFQPMDKAVARKQAKLNSCDKIILFAGAFDNAVKNYPLAKDAVSNLSGVTLMELKKYKRLQVAMLLNACDVLLLTSFSEGSPQIVKEAMACNCPIVATDVGDIKLVIAQTGGCFIAHFDTKDVTEKIQLALNFTSRTNGRPKVARFDNAIIAQRISGVYQKIVPTKFLKTR